MSSNTKTRMILAAAVSGTLSVALFASIYLPFYADINSMRSRLKDIENRKADGDSMSESSAGGLKGSMWSNIDRTIKKKST